MQKWYLQLINIIIMAIVITYSSCIKKDVPCVVTKPLANIGTRSVTAGGIITSDGGSKVLQAGVCWSSFVPSIIDNNNKDGTNMIDYNSTITSLYPGSVFFIRAYATNEVGTGYGETLSFKTLGKLPVAVTELATNILQESVTLNGTVNPGYLETGVSFEYGETLKYGKIAIYSYNYVYGNSDTPISVDITGLLPGTLYHYRINTANGMGGGIGNDLTFTTLSKK